MDFILKEYHRNITDNELLEDLKNVASKLDSSKITVNEYSKIGKYDYKTFKIRFGGWQKALELAGLKKYDPRNKKISDEELMDNLELVWIKLGKQPQATDLILPISKYSRTPYLRRFGTWRASLEYFIEYINDRQKQIIKDSELTSLHSTKRDINLRMRFLIMKRDNFKCCICGRSPATTPGLELHIDHIKPWSKGGETTIDNLQTLCSDCNLGKNNLEL